MVVPSRPSPKRSEGWGTPDLQWMWVLRLSESCGDGDRPHWLDPLVVNHRHGVRENRIDSSAGRKILWRRGDSLCRRAGQGAHDDKEIADTEACIAFEVEEADFIFLADGLRLR